MKHLSRDQTFSKKKLSRKIMLLKMRVVSHQSVHTITVILLLTLNWDCHHPDIFQLIKFREGGVLCPLRLLINHLITTRLEVQTLRRLLKFVGYKFNIKCTITYCTYERLMYSVIYFYLLFSLICLKVLAVIGILKFLYIMFFIILVVNF